MEKAPQKTKGKKEKKDGILQIRIQSRIKYEAEKILDELGLTSSQAVNIFFKQLIREKGVPFKVTMMEEEVEVLDERTLEQVKLAIEAYERGEYVEINPSIPGALESHLDSILK